MCAFFLRRFFAQSAWDGKTRMNIIINLDKQSQKSKSGNPFFEKFPSVWLASYEPSESEWTVLLIPDNTWVDLIYGYGSYRAQAIYPLGLIEGKAGTFFQNSFAYFLGLPIDGWGASLEEIAQKSAYASELNSQNVKSILADYFFATFRGKTSQTNLSAYDGLRLYWASKNIDSRKVKVVDLAEYNATDEQTLPDGTVVLALDNPRFDRLASSEFDIQAVKKEALDIAVFNTTGVTGIGTKASRLVSNIGGHVVKIGETESRPDAQRCLVLSQSQVADSATVRVISRAFKCQTASQTDTEKYRAKVILFLGNKFAEQFYSR